MSTASKSNLLFSIITICKDNLEELQATYSSIYDQNFKQFEWIVIDGGSTDGIKEWLQKSSVASNWISEPDDGIYDAMNKGILKAAGDYLIFMNSGDEFAGPKVLTEVHSRISQRNDHPVLIYGDSIDVDEKKQQHYRKSKKITSIKYGMITNHQAMFFHKNAKPGLMYEKKYRLSADYAVISGIIKHNKPEHILRLDFPICRFQMGGLNESKRFKAMREDYMIRNKILRLSWLESSILYLLHFGHALLKKSFKQSRFIRHRNIPANNPNYS